MLIIALGVCQLTATMKREYGLPKWGEIKSYACGLRASSSESQIIKLKSLSSVNEQLPM